MKFLIKIATFTLVFLFLISPVFSVSIGVSPGRVVFDNLLQSGYAERTVTISTNSEEILAGTARPRGDIASWITFNPDSSDFQISKSDPYKLKVVVQPPEDIPNGNYSGSIEFVTDTIGSVSGRAGGIVKAAVTQLINVEVSGNEIIECRAGAFSIKDTELGFPLEFSATVINDGNVRLNPTFTFDFQNQFQEGTILEEELIGQEVLPTTESKIIGRIDQNLDVGQYWVNALAEECDTKQVLTFSIVEKGGIIDKGFLKSIFNKPWVSVGETVEFVIRFANQGQRDVSAIFKGTIRLDDKIVEVIETEEVIVSAGTEEDISVFYSPIESGRHVLSGRVTYNKKLTFEKSSVLNVEKGVDVKESFNFFPLLLYLIIVVTILFIARKIFKEKRKHF